MKISTKSFPVLFFTLFLMISQSCKKDNAEPNKKNDLIKSLFIARQMVNGTTGTTFELVYDSQNRLIKLADDVFSYNKEGQVEKRFLTNHENKLIYEYAYVWDDLGRLKKIVLNYYKPQDNSSNVDIAQGKPIIAKFEYQNSERNPSRIIWRKILLNNKNSILTPSLSKEDTIQYFYDEDQLSKVIFNGPIDSHPYNIFGENSEDYVFHLFYKYEEKSHFLKNIYDQMGFNPINFTEVITSKQPTQSLAIASSNKISEIQEDWSQGYHYDNNYDRQFRPIKISIVQKIVGLPNIDFQPPFWGIHYQIKY